MKKEALIGGLAASHGERNAQDILDDKIREAGLPLKESYNKNELIRLCRHMEASPDRFTRIIATYIKVKIIFTNE